MTPSTPMRGQRLRDQVLPDLARSLDSLLLHKLRTLLTMLGMIFGVAGACQNFCV